MHELKHTEAKRPAEARNLRSGCHFNHVTLFIVGTVRLWVRSVRRLRWEVNAFWVLSDTLYAGMHNLRKFEIWQRVCAEQCFWGYFPVLMHEGITRHWSNSFSHRRNSLGSVVVVGAGDWAAVRPMSHRSRGVTILHMIPTPQHDCCRGWRQSMTLSFVLVYKAWSNPSPPPPKSR